MNKFEINQTNFPQLWLLFQYALGGNVDKQRLILQTYHNEQTVLEVGCSVGNLADVFRKVRGVVYHGLDVDAKAIALAQQRFRQDPKFTFTCADLAQFSRDAQPFDLIYLAGVLHHLPDPQALLLIRSVLPLLAAHTRLLIVDPRPALPADTPLVRWYANVLEQGHHLRSAEALQVLVGAVPALKISAVQVVPVGATPFSWPLCAHFIVMELTLC